MNRLNVPNIILAFYLYIHIRDDGKCQIVARADYEGLGSILTSKEDIDIRVPISQEPTAASIILDDENIKPRNFLIRRRESKKLTPEELRSISRSKKGKQRKKRRKKDKKTVVKTFVKSLQNQTGHNKLKPFDIVIHIKLNE